MSTFCIILADSIEESFQVAIEYVGSPLIWDLFKSQFQSPESQALTMLKLAFTSSREISTEISPQIHLIRSHVEMLQTDRIMASTPV